jgi:hypothetical protein
VRYAIQAVMKVLVAATSCCRLDQHHQSPGPTEYTISCCLLPRPYPFTPALTCSNLVSWPSGPEAFTPAREQRPLVLEIHDPGHVSPSLKP